MDFGGAHGLLKRTWNSEGTWNSNAPGLLKHMGGLGCTLTPEAQDL